MKLFVTESGQFRYGYPSRHVQATKVIEIDPTITSANVYIEMHDKMFVSKIAYRRLIENHGLLSDVLDNANQWESDIPLEEIFKEAAMDNEIKEDNVNHPKHYNSYSFEVIDIIDEVVVHFPVVAVVYIGNVIKYVLRAPFKGRLVEDLEKAEWYLHRAIEKLKKESK